MIINEMNELLANNFGIESRFSRRISFSSWDCARASRVLEKIIFDMGMEISEETKALIPEMMTDLINAPGWSSGRDVKSWPDDLCGIVDLNLIMVTHQHLRFTLDKFIEKKVKGVYTGSRISVQNYSTVPMQNDVYMPFQTRQVVSTATEHESDKKESQTSKNTQNGMVRGADLFQILRDAFGEVEKIWFIVRFLCRLSNLKYICLKFINFQDRIVKQKMKCNDDF